MSNWKRRATFWAWVVAALIGAKANATADQIFPEIYVHNLTGSQFSTSARVDGKWDHPQGWPAPGYVTNPDGSPPSTIGANQTIDPFQNGQTTVRQTLR